VTVILALGFLVSLPTFVICGGAYLISARRLSIRLRDFHIVPLRSVSDARTQIQYLTGAKESGIADSETVALKNTTRRLLRVAMWALATLMLCSFLSLAGAGRAAA
jgi:hypothetical protein